MPVFWISEFSEIGNSSIYYPGRSQFWKGRLESRA